MLVLFLSVALLAGACTGEEEDIAQNGSDVISRDPQTPIVIPAGEPIVVGVSAALTGPIKSRGVERRDATVVAAIAAQRLLDKEGVVGVIGPQCSGGAVTAIPV